MAPKTLSFDFAIFDLDYDQDMGLVTESNTVRIEDVYYNEDDAQIVENNRRRELDLMVDKLEFEDAQDNIQNPNYYAHNILNWNGIHSCFDDVPIQNIIVYKHQDKHYCGKCFEEVNEILAYITIPIHNMDTNTANCIKIQHYTLNRRRYISVEHNGNEGILFTMNEYGFINGYNGDIYIPLNVISKTVKEWCTMEIPPSYDLIYTYFPNGDYKMQYRYFTSIS